MSRSLQVHLGFYTTERDAGQAYDRAAINKGARQGSRIVTNFDIQEYAAELEFLRRVPETAFVETLANEQCVICSIISWKLTASNLGTCLINSSLRLQSDCLQQPLAPQSTLVSATHISSFDQGCNTSCLMDTSYSAIFALTELCITMLLLTSVTVMQKRVSLFHMCISPGLSTDAGGGVPSWPCCPMQVLRKVQKFLDLSLRLARTCPKSSLPKAS